MRFGIHTELQLGPAQERREHVCVETLVQVTPRLPRCPEPARRGTGEGR